VKNREWTFEGGNPSTSTFPNPKVTYSQGGTYKVTLKVSNEFGENEMTKTEFITVLPAEGDLIAPVTEDMEADGFESEWTMETSGIFGWKLERGRSYSGDYSFRANINSATDENFKFELISPPFDITPLEGLVPKLSFRVAYSLREQNSGELLAVYASKDCGKTWTVLRGFLGATTLKSVDGLNSNWQPSALTDWHTLSTDLDRLDYDATSNLLFKFEVTSRAGNSVFIDDINVGLNNVSVPGRAELANLQVSPNPSTGVVHVSLIDHKRSVSDVSILDITGRELYRRALTYKGAEASLDLDFETNGIYYIRIGNSVGHTTKKVIIAK